MTSPTDDTDVLTGVLVPIRSFDDAKSRLHEALEPSERVELMRSLAERVLDAAGGRPVWVVSEDPDVCAWATRRGALPMPVGMTGLNESVSAAVDALRDRGFDRAVIAHADLALVEDLGPVVGPGFRIAPDRARDGSNVICLPTRSGFRFAYGPGSFERHVREAERLGLAITVVDDPTLAVDIDEPEDLRYVETAKEPA